MKIILLFIGVVCLHSITHASSCCGAGSSSVSFGVPTIGKGEILFSGGYAYSQGRALVFHSNGLPMTGVYGITDRLAFSCKTSYVWLSNSLFKPGKKGTKDTTFFFKNHGFTDGIIGGQFIVLPMTALVLHELKCGVDVTIPWSRADKEIEISGQNTIMPPKVQTGMGVFAMSFYSVYSKIFPFQKIITSAAFSARIKFTDKQGTNFGDDAAGRLTLGYGPLFMTKVLLSFNYSAISQNKDKKGIKDTLTGGQSFGCIPSIEYTLSENVKIVADSRVTLWQTSASKENANTVEMSAGCVITIPRIH